MPAVGQFPTIAPKQKQTMGFDFGNFLPAGASLTGTPTLVVTAKYGTDSSAQSRVSSGPSIGTISALNGGTGIENAAIIFQMFGCLSGVDYTLEVVCTRTDGDIAEGWGILPCKAPGIL